MPEEKSSNKGLLITLLILVILLILITGGILYNIIIQKQQDRKALITPTITPIVSPTTQATLSSTITPTKKDTTQEDTEDIRSALATKHGKSINETIITVSKDTGTHAQGGIRFSGEESGAAWFAAKNASGEWVIVYDGQGVIPCDDIAPYNFPKDMIPECWDEATGQNVVR